MSRKITEKIAISILKSSRPRKGSYDRLQVAFDMAIEALKKQIPKPVDGVCGEYKNAKCPICHSFLRFPDEFCSWCGQKLDWE